MLRLRVAGFLNSRKVFRFDWIAREEPLEIRVRNRPIAVIMRTPGNDPELAAGFLFTEGVIRGPEDIGAIAHCEGSEHGNVANVIPTGKVYLSRARRRTYAVSSCGLCGKQAIAAIRRRLAPIQSSLRMGAETLLRMPGQMRRLQRNFSRTGAVHAAALFDAAGRLLSLMEDVGRHNAVDKLVGEALLAGRLPLSDRVIFVSGRASFEIVQKAAAAGIPLVAAVSAPSTLAVELAEQLGMTLVGLVRGTTMNIYAGHERIRVSNDLARP